MNKKISSSVNSSTSSPDNSRFARIGELYAEMKRLEFEELEAQISKYQASSSTADTRLIHELSMPQVRKKCRVGNVTIYEAMRAGHLMPSKDTKGQWIFSEAEVMAWMFQRRRSFPQGAAAIAAEPKQLIGRERGRHLKINHNGTHPG